MAWTSALSTYALITLAELNATLHEPVETDADSRPQDDRKERIINQASLEIENVLGRQIVTRGALTEYHTMPSIGRREFYLGQYPVISVTSVHEDTNWEADPTTAYGSDELLTVNEDYIAITTGREPAPIGKLYRLGGSWATGRRAIKVIYAAGYATTSAVPGALKAVAMEVCARRWRQERDGRGGGEVQNLTDGIGTTTRMLPAILTAKDLERLTPYRQIDFAPTWEAA